MTALRSQIGTNEGRFDVLKRETVGNFMDADSAVARLERLARGGSAPIRADAARLLTDLERGDDY